MITLPTNQETGEEVLTALDLGTTKVCAVLGLSKGGALSVLGMGQAASHGMQKGTVVDIESTVEAIQRALQEAEGQSGAKAGVVYASIGGNHIRTASSQAMITIANRDHEITEDDLKRVIDQAQNISLPSDHEILHAIVQEFSVDNQDGIRNPVGMYGSKLEARVTIITGAITCIQNVIRSVRRAELTFGGLILQAFASEKSVLTHEERELGVISLDIGGGTTDMAVMMGKALRHVGVITLGGYQITKDIAFGLRIPFAAAEEIKCRAGCSLASEVGDGEMAHIPAVGGRQPKSVPKRAIARIIEPRIEEILEQVREELRSAGCTEEQLGGGLVLTGGCAALPFIVEKAEQVFSQISARVGEPTPLPNAPDVLGLPAYATVVGLLQEAVTQRRHVDVRRRRFPLSGVTRWLKDLWHES